MVAGLPPREFAYLFGLYLGDGWLTPYPRDVYKLRVALDSRYPRIIAECVSAIRAVMPDNRVHVRKHPEHNVVEVGCYSKAWPTVFPQHAVGRKHDRAILIDPWQGRILEGNCEPLLRGLIHSDGCRVLNNVRSRSEPPKTYTYPRYQFTNHSPDIRAIFTGACEELGVHWTQMNRWNVAVSRRADVERLDSFIGPKA